MGRAHRRNSVLVVPRMGPGSARGSSRTFHASIHAGGTDRPLKILGLVRCTSVHETALGNPLPEPSFAPSTPPSHTLQRTHLERSLRARCASLERGEGGARVPGDRLVFLLHTGMRPLRCRVEEIRPRKRNSSMRDLSTSVTRLKRNPAFNGMRALVRAAGHVYLLMRASRHNEKDKILSRRNLLPRLREKPPDRSSARTAVDRIHTVRRSAALEKFSRIFR